MLTPDCTPADIGRFVVCTDSLGRVEEGWIVSFNAAYVFVCYRGCTSAATPRETLAWPVARAPVRVSAYESCYGRAG